MYGRKGDICSAIYFEFFQDLRLTMYLKMLFIIPKITSSRIVKQFISPKFGMYLLGAMDVASVYRSSVPEFNYRRDVYFHEYIT